MISQPGLKIIGGIDPHWIKHRQDAPDPGQLDLARDVLRLFESHSPPPHLSSSVHSRDLIANQYALDSQIGLD